MNKRHSITFCALILTVLILFVGCSQLLQDFENAELRQNAETMLDALITNDAETAYSLVSHLCSKEDFQPLFAEMRNFLGGAKTYELTLLHVSSHSMLSNGQTINSVNSIYELNTDTDRIILNIRMDNQNGLHTFQLVPFENTDYYFTGTLESLENASVSQWLILLSNIIAIGIAVFALVDCCRHKIKKKVLWILLLVFGFVSLGVTVGSSVFRFHFNIGWTSAYSALIRYGSGTMTFRAMIPIGAIIYLFRRRSLFESPTDASSSEEMQIDSAAQAADTQSQEIMESQSS